MVRGEARELVMKLIFQMEAQNDYSTCIRDKFYKEYAEGESQKEYMNGLLNSIIENREVIDSAIDKYSTNWNIRRMAKVDLAITRLAVAEIMILEDVPDSVAINEAVNIAKKYSTEESSKFINGILGKIEKEKNAN
ncbi:MAG: transcription antitermination factor NusB [Peptostreptococcaceae bacterium]|nr:transcription antitermination factor NusB [Peptostreptococcaceae bacterium]